MAAGACSSTVSAFQYPATNIEEELLVRGDNDLKDFYRYDECLMSSVPVPHSDSRLYPKIGHLSPISALGVDLCSSLNLVRSENDLTDHDGLTEIMSV